MQTTFALDERRATERTAAPVARHAAARHCAGGLVAVAVLLPLVALIMMSQRLSVSNSSLIISGLTGIVPSALCRTDNRQATPAAFSREQVLAALRVP